MAKLGGRPGQSAHFAATVSLRVCENNETLCHTEECDLDLDQKDEADPHNYQPIFTLHSKECQRMDSWCYFCQAYDDQDQPLKGPKGCSYKEGLPSKRNCNAKKGDLGIKEDWGCKTTYAIVAGQSEVIEKDCIAIPIKKQKMQENQVECQSLDNSDYEVQCTCYQGSGCNLNNDDVNTVEENAILSEVNKSIRQLREDLKRAIRRYSKPEE